MENCLFCKIIKGEIPSYKIYEDEYTYAFLDISKDVDGHTLVVPKKHFNNTLDCDEVTLTHIMKTVQLISNHYINNCGYSGVNIYNNNGSSAQQAIMHTHYHIIPRKDNDNFDIFTKLNESHYSLDEIHTKLKIN